MIWVLKIVVWLTLDENKFLHTYKGRFGEISVSDTSVFYWFGVELWINVEEVPATVPDIQHSRFSPEDDVKARFKLRPYIRLNLLKV